MEITIIYSAASFLGGVVITLGLTLVKFYGVVSTLSANVSNLKEAVEGIKKALDSHIAAPTEYCDSHQKHSQLLERLETGQKIIMRKVGLE